jgi:hypothetical protein
MQTDAIVSGETRAALSHENFNALVPLLSDLYLLPQKCYKYQTSSEHMNKEKETGLTYTKHANLCHRQWRDEGSLEPRKFQRMGPSPLRPSTTTPPVQPTQTKTNLTDPQSLQPPSSTYLCPMERPPKPPPPAPT